MMVEVPIISFRTRAVILPSMVQTIYKKITKIIATVKESQVLEVVNLRITLLAKYLRLVVPKLSSFSSCSINKL